MGQRNLCICEKETAYAEHLAEMLTEKKEMTLAVCFCSTWERTIALEKTQGIDILLIEEECALQKREQIPARKKFVLTRGKDGTLGVGETGIYKYQSAETIFSEMVQACMGTKEEELFYCVLKKKKEIIGVYSPVQRCGKTTFAIALGKELARLGSVLYINLEGYAGIGGHFPKESGCTLSDILYYARQEGNLGLRLSTMVSQFGELDYIRPCKVCMDIQSVLFEEWQELLGKILEESIYETIILDMGDSVQGLLELLTQCNVVYMPIRKDPIAKSKIRQYEEGIQLLGKEELMEKTVQIILPKDMNEYVRKMIREKRKKESP
ncbi:MAG: hypothetical protein RR869_03280 [Lachnospiraceae bacterium]